MKKISLLLCAFIASAAFVKAQDHVVTLKTTDKFTGNHILKSTAYLLPDTLGSDDKKGLKSIESDSTGKLVIIVPNSPRKWNILVNSIGYAQEKISVQTSSKENTRLFYTVKLDPLKQK
jgi:hypothetical protein